MLKGKPEIAYTTRVKRGRELEEWLWHPSRKQWLSERVNQLRSFSDLTSLHNSPFWQAEGAALLDFMLTIQAGAPGEGLPPGSSTESLIDPSLPESSQINSTGSDSPGRVTRVVHWNVLKGIRFDALVQTLFEDPRLRNADILLLNEVDVGMARSGNRHVASELGARLNRHWAFSPSYLELTKGIGSDLEAPGENEIGLHGVAILSRRAPLSIAAVGLPEVFDAFSFHEKRFGRRVGLLTRQAAGQEDISATPGPEATGRRDDLVAATAHLEVRNVPTGRERQMRALVTGLERFQSEIDSGGQDEIPTLISGDFNTHTFPRGSLMHSCQALLTLLMTPQGSLSRRLMKPWLRNREPLFDVLRRAGYEWESLNLYRPTAWAPFSAIEEGERLAGGMKKIVRGMLERDRRGIPLHLDWFVGRGFEPAGRVADSVAAEGSPHLIEPILLDDLLAENAPSDHAPIVLDLV